MLSGFDESGQKFVILPIDETYSVAITGREDDLVNYGVSEYSAIAGDFTRNINYFDVKVKKGETIFAVLPSYTEEEIENDTPNGSSVSYILTDSNNKKIECSSDLTGEDSVNSCCSVNVYSNDENLGAVLGGGIKQYGEFIQVEAVSNDESEFTGWYINGKCVSTEESYRFCVKNDVEITAKFESKEENKPDILTRIIDLILFIIEFIYSMVKSFIG